MKRGLILMMVLATVMAMAEAQVEIRLNQVGYYPMEQKAVVVEGTDPTGVITVEDSKGKTVFRPTAVREVKAPWGEKVRYVVDVSGLRNEGEYMVCVGDTRKKLTVARDALGEVAKASLKLFYLIRSGVEIEERFAGVYARPLGHPDTAVWVHPSAASEGRPAGTVICSPLGWYDAGDYNKYVVNSAFSMGLMMAVYEQNRGYFDRLKTNIPESGNSTADLIDEVVFNMKWLLTMQDPGDGGVYHKLTTPNFEGFVMPTDCRQQRYVVAKSVTATLDFAAVMAQMARVLRGNGDYGYLQKQAERAAVRAYEWAEENPKAYYRQEEMNKRHDPDVNTGGYGDGNTRDEWFWAATELYRLTKERKYKDCAIRMMPQHFSAPTWGNVSGLGAFAWLAEGDKEIGDKVKVMLATYCNELIANVSTSSWQAPYGDSRRDFGWGALAERCCAPGIALLFADRYVTSGRYRQYALQNADCLLGRNATGYCFVTGFGEKSPMYPHHRISGADSIREPFPGMLAGGPNPAQQDKKDSKLTYPSSLPDESYLDEQPSYASNEIAINWNASLVGLLCWLAQF